MNVEQKLHNSLNFKRELYPKYLKKNRVFPLLNKKGSAKDNLRLTSRTHETSCHLNVKCVLESFVFEPDIKGNQVVLRNLQCAHNPDIKLN